MKKCIFVVLVLIILLLCYLFFLSPLSPSENVEQVKPPAPVSLPEKIEEKPAYETLESNFISEVEAENDATTFPSLWGDYTKHLGFDSYMKEMEKCGAVCFFLSKSKNVFIKIDYTNSSTEEFSIYGFASKWGNTPAQIQGEKSLAKFIENNESEIFLAKPLAMEGKIESEVRNYLNANQIRIKDILSLKGEYLMNQGSFCLRVYEILYRNSSLEKVDIKIYL